ncbi:MAG: hypothetical protein FWG31_04475 [Oscillospiraceae bacterium]|nr:hypothetical protein [Oscillospiraceae bacterium]
MASEKERIVKMLDEGKINTEEAAKLLELLSADQPEKPKPAAAQNPALKGKKLRVKVSGSVNTKDEDIGEIENINVNVAVPLALVGVVDNLLATVIPNEAHKELEKQGIDLKGLNLGSIVDALTDTDEDIVNVDLAMKGKPLTVRVYVE